MFSHTITPKIWFNISNIAVAGGGFKQLKEQQTPMAAEGLSPCQ